MPANKRIYYAIKQVGIKNDGDTGVYTVVYGAQDISLSTSFNQTQIFELGQLSIYQTVEDLPDVEVTISKVFDGKPLIWHLATRSATTSPDLAGRSNASCILGLGIFSDDKSSATGTPENVVQCSGMFPKNISYSFGLDGAFTESLSFAGNDKLYSGDARVVNPAATGRQGGLNFPGQFTTNSDSTSGLERSNALLWTVTGGAADINGQSSDVNATILPPEVDGISNSGINTNVGGVLGAHVQSIQISTDLGREQLRELGRLGPYHRYATFPVEVTCAIEAISTRGDNISATEAGIYTTGTDCSAGNANLKNRSIRIATCGGVRIYLGAKNRLQSVEYGGGTTDGGNDTNTYNYTNFNDLTVMAQYDPNPSGNAWWTARWTHLRTMP